MAERKAVAAAARYQRAQKKEKAKILDQFIALTGYHRVYARAVLREAGKKVDKEKPRRAAAAAPARGKVLQISAATIDRLLRAERRKHEVRGRGRTKQERC